MAMSRVRILYTKTLPGETLNFLDHLSRLLDTTALGLLGTVSINCLLEGDVTESLLHPFQIIAAYLYVLDKLQGKVVTHLSEVEWWRTLMVECVTLIAKLSFSSTSAQLQLQLSWKLR